MNIPFKKLSEEAKKIIFEGTKDEKYYVSFSQNSSQGVFTTFEGVNNNLKKKYLETDSSYIRSEISKYMKEDICLMCKGKRLRKEVLSVLIEDKSIIDITELSIDKCIEYFKNIK